MYFKIMLMILIMLGVFILQNTAQPAWRDGTHVSGQIDTTVSMLQAYGRPDPGS